MQKSSRFPVTEDLENLLLLISSIAGPENEPWHFCDLLSVILQEQQRRRILH